MGRLNVPVNAQSAQLVPQTIDVSSFPAVNTAIGGGHGIGVFTADGVTWTAMILQVGFFAPGPSLLPSGLSSTGPDAQSAVSAVLAALSAAAGAKAIDTAAAAQDAAVVAAALTAAIGKG